MHGRLEGLTRSSEVWASLATRFVRGEGVSGLGTRKAKRTGCTTVSLPTPHQTATRDTPMSWHHGGGTLTHRRHPLPCLCSTASSFLISLRAASLPHTVSQVYTVLCKYICTIIGYWDLIASEKEVGDELIKFLREAIKQMVPVIVGSLKYSICLLLNWELHLLGQHSLIEEPLRS
jgi:hypothetical protein